MVNIKISSILVEKVLILEVCEVSDNCFESLSAVNLHFFDGEKTNFANFYY